MADKCPKGNVLRSLDVSAAQHQRCEHIAAVLRHRLTWKNFMTHEPLVYLRDPPAEAMAMIQEGTWNLRMKTL